MCFGACDFETYIFAESASYPFNNSHVPYDPAFRLHPGDPISRPAGAGEGYRLRPGVTTRNPETLVYGVNNGYPRRFESLGSIIETITVFSDGIKRGDVAYMSHCLWGDEQAHANARLMAAAPDMLDSLLDLVALLPDPELDNDSLQREFVIKARAAIVKAGGNDE